MATIDAELRLMWTKIGQPSALARGVISRTKRSELAAAVMLSVFLPAMSTATDAEDRANMRLDLARFAAALAVYRAEYDRYPAKLSDLVPTVVDAIPQDVYSGQPPVYVVDEDGGGYLLYSVGRNGMDDGGTDEAGRIVEGAWIGLEEESSRDGDDLVIRLPLPLLEIPDIVSKRQQLE